MDTAAIGDSHSRFCPASAARGPLIVRLPNWVGEAVLSIPTLAMLQQVGYQLHLVGKPWVSDLFAGFNWSVHPRPPKLGSALAQMWRLRRELSATDTSFGRRINTLLLTDSHSSAVETRYAGLRPLGYATDYRWHLLARVVKSVPDLHVADEYWRIGAALVGDDLPQHRIQLSLTPSQQQIEQAQSLLRTRQISSDYVVLCPFSGDGDSSGKKRWPAFPEFAQRLSAEGIAVVLCPGPNEEAEARQLYPDTTILPSISLGVYASLMRDARCTIANDTGPGHMAAAAGAALLSVFGPHSSNRWTPVGPRAKLIRCDSHWPAIEEVLAQLPAWRQE